jgi:hypothetical protein
MDLNQLKLTWNELGKMRPYWAVIAAQTEGDDKALFKSGKKEVNRDLKLIRRHLTPVYGLALDFGCGLGRLARFTARRFQNVIGLDIAQSMIEKAKLLNKDVENLNFVLNDKNDLSMFSSDTFDYCYSKLVLQHMPNGLSGNYIAEFIRVTKPNSPILFQIPVGMASDKSLSKSEMRARIKVVKRLPDPVPAGSIMPLIFEITNMSNITWEPSMRIKLGAKIFKEGNLADSSQRFWNNKALKPNKSFYVKCNFQIPNEPGTYEVIFDLIQDYVGWFNENNADNVKSILNVTGRPKDVITIPQIEMHSLSADKIRDIVDCHGAQIVAEVNDNMAGPEWRSITYLLKKI